MTISFNSIPSNLRVPLFYAEFDNSNANQGGATQEYNVLLIGPKLSSGTKDELTLHRITSAGQAKEYFGDGSVLADMAAAHLELNKIHALYCIAIDDNGSGVAASGKITFTGTATAAGTISAMVGGRLYQAAVASGDDASDCAAALTAAIQADSSRLVTAAQGVSAEDDECQLTARNDGTQGNEIDVRLNYFDGEALPAGITAAVTAMASGATNPDVDEVWPVLGDARQYILMVTPWLDATNLGKMETELADRFGPLRGTLDGYAIYGKRETFGNLVTLGEGRNSQFTSIVGIKGPSNPWVWASEIAAQVALSAANDPARPFQTLALNVHAPAVSERFTLEERNQLLYSGIGTYMVDSGSNVLIEAVITTYKEDSFGSPDASYLYLTTPLTLSYLRFDWRAMITSKYPRHKLADDGTKFDPGQAIVTPNVIKAELYNKFREWEGKGLVENFDQFKEDLIVERNADNPNRLDVLAAPDLVNQLRVFGGKIQFLL